MDFNNTINELIKISPFLAFVITASYYGGKFLINKLAMTETRLDKALNDRVEAIRAENENQKAIIESLTKELNAKDDKLLNLYTTSTKVNAEITNLISNLQTSSNNDNQSILKLLEKIKGDQEKIKEIIQQK